MESIKPIKPEVLPELSDLQINKLAEILESYEESEPDEVEILEGVLESIEDEIIELIVTHNIVRTDLIHAIIKKVMNADD